MRGDFGTRKTVSFERSCPADVSSDSLSLRKDGQPLPLVRLVRRPAVQRAITAALERDSLAVLCAEPGLGAHCVSRLVGTSYVDAGLEAIRVKLNVKSASAICRRISKSVSRCLRDWARSHLDFSCLMDSTSSMKGSQLVLRSISLAQSLLVFTFSF